MASGPLTGIPDALVLTVLDEVQRRLKESQVDVVARTCNLDLQDPQLAQTYSFIRGTLAAHLELNNILEDIKKELL